MEEEETTEFKLKDLQAQIDDLNNRLYEANNKIADLNLKQMDTEARNYYVENFLGNYSGSSNGLYFK